MTSKYFCLKIILGSTLYASFKEITMKWFYGELYAPNGSIFRQQFIHEFFLLPTDKIFDIYENQNDLKVKITYDIKYDTICKLRERFERTYSSSM